MTYISSLISGVGIFCFGTGLAWYHGVLVLLHPQEMQSVFWVTRTLSRIVWALVFFSGSCLAQWFIDFRRRLVRSMLICVNWDYFSNTLYGCQWNSSISQRDRHEILGIRYCIRRWCSSLCHSVFFFSVVSQGYKPNVNVILLEDLAAVLGVTVAATAMGLSVYLQSPIPDAIGSLIIGGILGGVASFIIYSNTAALVGR